MIVNYVNVVTSILCFMKWMKVRFLSRFEIFSRMIHPHLTANDVCVSYGERQDLSVFLFMNVV